ncbi:helix-turn-helix domain-containing protein [Chloroflexota bacterium]
MNTDQHSEWVSLSEAAQILGVHPATVRNWADRGDLPMRRTPGGHRRFKRSDLELWVATNQPPPPAEIQMLIQNALGRMRLHINDGEMSHLAWYNQMDEAGRQTMRDKGLLMLEALQKYLADPDDAAPVIRQLGEDYAQFLNAQNLTLEQTVEGFLVFSNFLHEAALNIIEVVQAQPQSEWLKLLRQVRTFTNELLLGLIHNYQS